MLAIRGLSLHLGPLARPARVARNLLPPVNFLTLHYTYFIITCLISALIFWGSSTPARSVDFTDSLFLCVSAMTLTGLNTINLSTLNTFQQFTLFLLIMLGSAIFVSAFTVHIRRRAFEKKFRIVEEERRSGSATMRKSSRTSLSLSKAFSRNENVDSTSRGRATRITTSTPPNFPTAEDGAQARRTSSAADSPHHPHAQTVQYGAFHGLYGQRDSSAIAFDEADDDQDAERAPERITFSPDTRFRAQIRDNDVSPLRRHRSSFISMQGVGALSHASLHSIRTASPSEMLDAEKVQPARKSTDDYGPSTGHIGRNSQFHGLSEDERERLGGVEYSALLWLSWLVPLYYVLWQLLGCLGLAAYVSHNRADATRTNGLNPWWVGAFNGVSAFNNSGMSLLDANMTAFQTSIYMLLTMGLMILAGNTCYPIFLRLIIWTLRTMMPNVEGWRHHHSTLTFLLEHPRRCYTNLFPSHHTWWLLVAVITLNGIDWAAFEILNIGNTTLNESLETKYRVLDGLFQALAVRSGGFYVVSIPSLRISLQVLYVVMMYISVYPVVITMRNSNVYEERSLGIYAGDPGFEHYGKDDTEQPQSFWRSFGGLKRRLTGAEDTKSYFVQQQMRAQLAHDAWWLVLAIFLIMIVEGGQFERNPSVFSVFNVIFEVVSGYGTVGLSVGLPDEAYSFCGAWHKLSKLILCAVMLRGRHRGLPVAIDKAVLLPGENLGRAEEEDAMIRMDRVASWNRSDRAV